MTGGHVHEPSVDAWSENTLDEDDLVAHLVGRHGIEPADSLPRPALEGAHREAHDRGWFT